MRVDVKSRSGVGFSHMHSRVATWRNVLVKRRSAASRSESGTQCNILVRKKRSGHLRRPGTRRLPGSFFYERVPRVRAFGYMPLHFFDADGRRLESRGSARDRFVSFSWGRAVNGAVLAILRSSIGIFLFLDKPASSVQVSGFALVGWVLFAFGLRNTLVIELLALAAFSVTETFLVSCT
jgi:hypothetical protein